MTDSTMESALLNGAQVEYPLNDKIQTTEDLQNLDSLLQALKNQQQLQLKQLAETEEILEKATRASKDHDDAVRSKADAFNKEQTDIDRRLMIVTGSDTSNEAVQRFEVGMEKLRKLDICKGYMETLKEVDRLSAEGLKNITTNARLSLRPYTNLRHIVSALKDAQPAAEDAAPHLVDYTEGLATSLGEQMRKQFGSSFQKTIEKMKWPGKDLVLTDDLIQEWTDGVELLLDLQEPELLDEYDSRETRSKSRSPPVLLPLELMAHPLGLRFKYHFSGNKVTNRLDKPEYFLSHTADLINTYHDFFVAYLQPVLDSRAAKLSLSMDWIYSDAISLWISALLPIVREKITTFLPQISSQPQLLSHFMHELMNFDSDIRGVWNYGQGPYSEDNWKGLSWEVLVQQDWFGRWLQVEKDFALSRYQDIIDTPDSGQIDYDGVEPGTTKPSTAAIRVNDLLETITERYRPLSSFSQKLRFLIDIQITIFDQFHERLHSGLEAYLAMTSTIGRTVQGSSTDNPASLDGVAGLERLCRVFGSAEYLEKKMQYWSDDVFFLELWYELQNRIKENSSTGRPVAGPMTVADVASRTSATVAHQNDEISDNTAEGALFDETASAYRRLRLRSESIIVSTLTSSAHTSLRQFSRISTWTSLDPASGNNTEYPLPPSTELVPTIRSLSSNISFLANALGNAPLKRITRQLLLSIQSYIWDNVLMRHTFSTAGSSQLRSDVDHICGVIDAAVGSHSGQGEAAGVIRKLNEGLLLLGLNISGPTPEAGDDALAEDEVDQEGKGLSLWEVEKKLFASNESARSVLSELGIEILSESEARAVLERRAEIRG